MDPAWSGGGRFGGGDPAAHQLQILPVRTVRAKVVDKSKVEFPSKYGTNTKYTVVFQTEGGKKLSFYVSEFSPR